MDCWLAGLLRLGACGLLVSRFAALSCAGLLVSRSVAVTCVLVVE